VLWLAAAREGLDDEHASAAAGARLRQHAGFVGRWGLWGILLFAADRDGEQLARPRDVGGAAATGQQSVVSDAMEALWQDVDQEAPDELVGCQRHRLVAGGALDAIILVPEGDAVLVGGHEPAIRDGDPVAIAREIGEHGPGAAERPLGIDHPIDLAQRRQKRLEGSDVIEAGVNAEKLEASGPVGGDELGQEQSPEQARENLHGQDEVWPARHPPRAINGDAAAWYDHVDMGMMRQRRAPSVKHRGDADAGAEVLGISRDGSHGLGRGREQDVVDHGLVLIADVRDGGRQREHRMKVRHRQQIGLARGEPFSGGRALTLRTMAIATAVVSDDRVRAIFAARDMAAERGRAAALNGRYDLHLAEADMAGIGLAPCWPMVAEDIRDLQQSTGHGRYAVGWSLLPLFLAFLGLLRGRDSRSSGLSMPAIRPVATRV
jgi:hypothetical protein